MKRIFAAAVVLCLATAQVPAAPFYEPFDYPAGPLAGNTNTSVAPLTPGDTTWTNAPAGVANPSVIEGNLSYPGLPASTGRSMFIDGAQNGGGARVAFGTEYGAGAGGTTVYYSGLLRVTNLTGASGSSFYGGLQFNPSSVTGGGMTGTSNTSAAALCVNPVLGDPTHYNLGIAYRDAGARIFAGSGAYAQGDTLFFVVKHEIRPGNKDDVSSLYIFRDDGTTADPIPASEPLTPTVMSANSASTAQFDYLYNASGVAIDNNLRSILFRSNAVQPDANTFDDIRVGGSWSEVVAIPEPATVGLVGCGALLMTCQGRRRGATNSSP